MTQSRAEVNAAARRVRAMIDLSERARARMESNSVRASSGSVTEKVVHEPVGVVAHVSAWNYPAFLAVNVLVPALLAGNAVLHKPSEHSPGVGERLRTLLLQSDVPSDVFQVCQGGRDVGRALVRLQGLGAVAFTGSREAGTEVAAVAARSHARAILELGGVDAAYVRRDVADVERARRAWRAGRSTTRDRGAARSSGSTSTATCTNHSSRRSCPRLPNFERATRRMKRRRWVRSCRARRCEGWRLT